MSLIMECLLTDYEIISIKWLESEKQRQINNTFTLKYEVNDEKKKYSLLERTGSELVFLEACKSEEPIKFIENPTLDYGNTKTMILE